MKILQVCNYFSPEHGGTAVSPFRLSLELAKKGHDITIFTSDYKISKDWLEKASKSNIKVHAFKTWINITGFQVTPSLFFTGKIIKSFQIIHMHNYRTLQNIIVYHYAKKYHIPYIVQARGSLTTFFQKGLLKRIFDIIWGNRILRDAVKLIALTKDEAKQYVQMGTKEEKVTILPNGINVSEFENLPEKGVFRKQWQIHVNEKVILFLARINKIKGLDILLKAFYQLVKNNPEVKLVIAGPDDGYLSRVQSLIQSLGIQNLVILTGPVYGNDKLSAYVDADVYVLPSYYEIFGNTVIEALACGTPVIVTDRCGTAESINEENAGLVVTHDSQQLGSALASILAKNEREKCSMGKKGIALVKNKYNWRNIVNELEMIYERSIF
jgi:glycosyltransferase involved in cell wall biosynthesis